MAILLGTRRPLQLPQYFPYTHLLVFEILDKLIMHLIIVTVVSYKENNALVMKNISHSKYAYRNVLAWATIKIP